MKKIPTFTGSGWIEDISAAALKMFEYFLHSEDDQTTLYRGNIASFPDIVKKYGNSPREMAIETETVLLHYFRRSFEQVNVQVKWDDIPDRPGFFNITIDLTIREKGSFYSLGSLLELSGGELTGVKMTKH